MWIVPWAFASIFQLILRFARCFDVCNPKLSTKRSRLCPIIRKWNPSFWRIIVCWSAFSFLCACFVQRKPLQFVFTTGQINFYFSWISKNVYCEDSINKHPKSSVCVFPQPAFFLHWHEKSYMLLRNICSEFAHISRVFRLFQSVDFVESKN